MSNIDWTKHFAKEIKEYIEYQNNTRGPYGLQIEVVQTKGKRFGSKTFTVNVYVEDKDGKRMWPAMPYSQEIDESTTVHLMNLAEAFTFKLG
jgi:hypothetical protein